MTDVCVHTCCRRDIECLDVLLYSLEKFANLASCNLLVSSNSADMAIRKTLIGICESHPTRSLNIDFFNPNETVDSNQHGEALNRLFARTTSKHVIVADPDVIVTSPGWLDFCKQHINQGCFIVGMPYETPEIHWQNDFPTVWLDMLDGDALRSAHLDMRTQHVRPIRRRRKAPFWRLSGRRGQYRDMGWELASHALKNGLDWISLTLASNRRLASDMRAWTNPSVPKRRAIRRAGKWLREIHPIEFLYPGTNELCCAHLGNGGLYGVGTPRTDKWVMCARMAVDMYAESYV